MKKYSYIFVCLACLSLACCGTKKNQKSEAQIKFDVQQDSIDMKVKETEGKYRAMTIDQLIPELETAAIRGEEPFNSGAFREIITRKESAPALFASITDTTQKEFFKLMALKKLDSRLFDSVAASSAIAILTDALKKSTVFNGWGIPNHYWESSAKALIGFDTQAKSRLENLLNDKRPAPVWGSEEAMVYETYKYRVCDYALALLYAIDKNERTQLPVSIEERDKLIAGYQK